MDYLDKSSTRACRTIVHFHATMKDIHDAINAKEKNALLDAASDLDDSCFNLGIAALTIAAQARCIRDAMEDVEDPEE